MKKYRYRWNNGQDAMRFIQDVVDAVNSSAASPPGKRGALSFTVTDDGELENIFWATGVQRQLAEQFGSIVIVDTTFNTHP